MTKNKFNIEYYRNKILFLLKNDKEINAKSIIYKIAKNKFIKCNDVKGLYNFFSPIYDELFYDIMIEKINITISTKELLEKLSLPLYKMNDNQKNFILNEIVEGDI